MFTALALSRTAARRSLALTTTGAYKGHPGVSFSRSTAVRQSSSNSTDNRGKNRHIRQKPSANEGGIDHAEDRFQYDFKEPLLDAGIANIFQVDENMLTIVENLSTGFRLSNGITAYGPLLLVNNEAFTLKIPPPRPDAVSGVVTNPLQLLDPEALKVLDVVTPKPELLVVGGGANISPLSPAARKYLTSIGLNVELASTRHASSTFNTLSEEGRNAALLVLPAGVTTNK
ncbi:hypothetical protein GGH94_004628 [Coemansia aciculifera]|uniref:NADH dehydrogenase [ubiquinone] 1 alpha subcomplex assembly factor 3 n=2 Tax=Coemansia TaxID=4863 RepID=A0A9W8LB78_9FUNG|nr:hypothetical protein GGI19_003760 [Coemansia pectinata]KAJ2861887.1 hypothetical protein GGH94_004628 [Coemansia aciculifera]KAJ2871325.1 hypothetical protein GGH93_004914 [Coemansia aciculifera]